MSDKSAIEWTDATWNPVTGCSKVSPACAHCLDPDTPILMADMTWRRISDVVPGDAVVGFTEGPMLGQNRTYVRSTVDRVWTTTAEAVEITINGRQLIASVDHRFLCRVRPYWREAANLSLRTGLVDIGAPEWVADTASEGYLAGYMAGAIGGDGTLRLAGSGKNGTLASYLRVAVLASDRIILDRLASGFAALGLEPPPVRPFDGGGGGFSTAQRQPLLKIETRKRDSIVAVRSGALPERPDPNWQAGFLAGFLDTDGCYTGKNLRFNQTKDNELLSIAERCIAALGFVPAREDFRSHAGRSVRLVGNVEDKIRFLGTIQPALDRKCTDFYGRRFPGKTASIVSGIRRVGRRDLVDIQTSSGTFIANGIATHNCYAERLSLRFGRSAGPWTPRNAAANVILHPDRLDVPLTWRQPRMVFVNSMSDLFHELVPDDYIDRVFATMAAAGQHTYQILTKRPERMAGWFRGPGARWAQSRLTNVWLGVSIENERWVGRADWLRATPAAVRFISAEPLLGPLPSLDLSEIDWLIVGGESGPGHRPMDPEWARDLRDRANEAGVSFFFKQWGGPTPRSRGRELDGRTWDGYPALREVEAAS